MRAADEAWSALDELLDEEWFFEQQKPGLFDASVFAYTHLLLDEAMEWEENRLGDVMRGMERIVQHRERIKDMYYQ